MAAVASGAFLGSVLGAAAPPIMKSAPEPAWRNHVQPPFSSQSMHFVERGPEDLSPQGGSYSPSEGAVILEPNGGPGAAVVDLADHSRPAQPSAPGGHTNHDLRNSPISVQAFVSTDAAAAADAGEVPNDPSL